MIDSIIAKYLKHNKRITIPEFGTLVRKDSEGIFVLVELLRKDDGVLAGLLSTEAGLPRQEAAAAIGKYVADIKERVANQGSVSLKGIGILSQDSEGFYELDSVKIHSKSETPAETKPAEPQPTESKPAETAKPDVAPREPKTEPKTEPKVEPRKPVRPAAAGRRSITVDENGDPVGDDLFDDTDRPKGLGSSVSAQAASLLTGAKDWVSSITGKLTSSGEKRRKRPARAESAVKAPDDRKSDTEAPHSAGESKRFSDLKPRPEIRGLRYKSSDGYPKQRKSAMDKVMMVAIVAAIIALIVMVYAQISNRLNRPEPLEDTQTEIMPDIQPSAPAEE